MHPIAQRAEILLQSNPHPSLRLTELTEVLRTEMDRTLTDARLRRLLSDYPARFRILESWEGGWRTMRREGSDGTWVVSIGGPAPVADRPPSVMRLRESVRWLACGLDDRSRADVSRWYAITLTERRTRRCFLRRAA